MASLVYSPKHRGSVQQLLTQRQEWANSRRMQPSGRLLELHRVLAKVLHQLPEDLVHIISSYCSAAMLVAADKANHCLLTYALSFDDDDEKDDVPSAQPSTSSRELRGTHTTRLLFRRRLCYKPVVNSPYDVCVDQKRGVFLVACRNPPRIAVVDYDGKLVKNLGTDRLECPCCVLVDHRGRIIVGEESVRGLVVFSFHDELLWKSRDLRGVTGVTVNSKGFVFAVACFSSSVVVFDGNDPDWRKVATIGVLDEVSESGGQQPDGLFFPWAITCDSRDRLIVSDGANHRIVVMSSRLDIPRSARVIASVGTGRPTSRKTGFRFPRGVSVDSQDNIYVSDRDNRLLKVYSPELELLDSVTCSFKRYRTPMVYGIECYAGR